MADAAPGAGALEEALLLADLAQLKLDEVGSAIARSVLGYA